MFDELRAWQKKKIERKNQERISHLTDIANKFIGLMAKEGMSVADVQLLSQIISQILAKSYADKKLSDVMNYAQSNEKSSQENSKEEVRDDNKQEG